jgi:23S rRNA pseudouridine1911/1915/1917 synthase
MEHAKVKSPSSAIHKLEVPSIGAKIRLDRFIAQQISHYSRSFIQKLIEQKNITLNGAIAKSSTLLKENDMIEINVPPVQPLYTTAPSPELLKALKDLDVAIIHNDPDFFIIAKPAGLMVHKPSSKSTDITLVDWLVNKVSTITNVGNPERPGIVHRLDKDTSGLIIVPRNNQAHNLFSTMFKQRTIQKTYYAIVQGHPESTGTIDLPIGRDRIHRNKMSQNGIESRASITHYKVLEYFQNASLLEISPITGRTHQIRVHLAAIGYPILGDALYGTTSKHIKRQALHAARVSFTFYEKKFSFHHPEPEDFKKLIQTLKNMQEKSTINFA